MLADNSANLNETLVTDQGDLEDARLQLSDSILQDIQAGVAEWQRRNSATIVKSDSLEPGVITQSGMPLQLFTANKEYSDRHLINRKESVITPDFTTHDHSANGVESEDDMVLMQVLHVLKQFSDELEEDLVKNNASPEKIQETAKVSQVL